MQRVIVIYLIYLISLAFCAPAWAVETDHINGISITSHKTYQGVWTISKIKAHNGFTIASPLTCTVLSANSTAASSESFWRYNNVQMRGLIWDDGASGSICTFKFFIISVTGDITDKDAYAEVWLLGASSELVTLVGRSDKVDCQNWSNTLVVFSFSTPAAYDCTGSNQYAILTKSVANDAAASTAAAYDGTDYPSMRRQVGTNTMTGCVSEGSWRSDTGAAVSHVATNMPYAEVWTLQ